MVTLTREGHLRLADGTVIAEFPLWFRGHIQHVTIPWGATLDGLPLTNGRARSPDHVGEALVTSILAVPFTQDLVPAGQDMGRLEFHYNSQPRFVAPVASLMNRYHGLTKMAAMTGRLRLVVDPSMGARDWLEDLSFTGPLLVPLRMRVGLPFSISHVAPPVPHHDSITVEIQALVHPAPFTDADFFKWTTTTAGTK